MSQIQSASGAPDVRAYIKDPDSEGVVRQALCDLDAGQAAFRPEGIAAALADVTTRSSPRLLIVDVSGQDDPAAAVRRLIEACEPSTTVIAVGAINDIRLYRSLHEAGVAEYFFKPLVTALVARACRKALLGETASEPEARLGRLIYVVGVRGGCGATTIGVTLAARLSEAPPRPVLLLDLDMQSGDAALSLDATPNSALREALSQGERVDDLFLERGLIHTRSRLDLLASLEPLDAPSALNETTLMSLLDKVRRRYRFVIADTPALAAAKLGRAIHLPSALLLVSDGRLVSAREVSRWRNWLGAKSAERSILHVLNMQGAPGGLHVEDFARAAGQRPDIVIPYDREIAESALIGLNGGPARNALGRALDPLVAMIGGAAAASKRSLLDRVLGG